ncbi:SpaH/EbpB family LPXTG-anchored major pilin [Gardnerella vaginalis]|uniref:SpaH/EbpB family LPXTG-anchored major pilin n=1 Tax=Gardnerella vaginalis TaxID=2702 RepID=UPI0039F10B96
MGTKPNSLKRAVALIAAACTLGTCCIAGSIAWAGDDANEADTANIDVNKKEQTSITIHKYEGPELTSVAHDGRELVTTGDNSVLKNADGKANKPVAGVVFTVWRLKSYQTGENKADEEIDLSTADGWKKIKEVQNLGKKADSSKGIKTVDQLMSGAAQKFNKYPASVDTTAPSGCTKAAAETAAGAQCKTDTNGSVKLSSLPMGLYYIEETDISNAKIDNNKVSITTKVAPFFITTPLPNSDTTTQKKTPWLYDVNVYPKNDTNTELPTKTGDVNRQDLAPDTTHKDGSNDVSNNDGTRITWTVSIPLTAPKDSTKYENVGFVDRLNEKLTYEKIASANIITYKEQAKADGTKEWVKDDSTTEVKLTKGTDYNLTDPVPGTGDGKNQNTLTFELTEGMAAVTTGTPSRATGRKAAFDAYKAVKDSKNPKKLAKLVVEIVTKVDPSITKIANVANTFVDETKTGKGKDPNNPCTPESKDPDCNDENIPNEIMNYGTLTVSKFFKGGDDNKKMPLNDAKFDLYEVTQKTVADKNGSKTIGATEITKATTFDAADISKTVNTITTKVDGGTGVSYDVKKITHEEPDQKNANQTIKEATTLETHHDKSAKTDGKDSIKLLVYKAPKGKAVNTTKLYCVVETQAPAGYNLDSAPHCVQLKADDEVDKTTDADHNLVEVPNSKATALDKILAALPMTGARGLVILTVCGIVGIAGTFFYIVMKRRKEQEAE